jgi:hypothetical protein
MELVLKYLERAITNRIAAVARAPDTVRIQLRLDDFRG